MNEKQQIEEALEQALMEDNEPRIEVLTHKLNDLKMMENNNEN